MCVVFVACDGVYTPGNLPSGSTGGNNGSNNGGNGGGSSSDDDWGEDAFTVQLINNKGEKIPSNPNYSNINAIWTNVASSNGAYVTAAFDKTGKASATGLDGDYSVTLSALPDGYTYNPNIYTATSDNPHIEIVLYELNSINDTGRQGTNWYDDVCEITEIGAYRVVLTADNFEDGVRFQYEPQYQGDYSIESMIDVTANKVNPYIDLHNGTVGFVNPNPYETRDGGGEENTYTKNFKWTISLTDRYKGNCYNFRIYATTLDKNVFPVTVDFILDRDGEVTAVNKYQRTTVEATHDFEAAAADAFEGTAGKTFTYYADYGDNNGTLDGTYVEFNSEDGYYYITKERKWNISAESYEIVSLETPLRLYASLKRNEVSDQGFTGEQVSLGWIEGKLSDLDDGTSSGAGDDEDRNKTRYFNYSSFVKKYADYSQNDLYPVTKELKIFMQRFSISQRYFNDGSGYAEAVYQSTESNQWLFACGYFK